MELPRTDPVDPRKEPEEGKEERLDSGLDSLQEEEYRAVAAELGRLQLEREPRPQPGEQPWKDHRTEDGDTLLHLAIIHEAKDYVSNIIALSTHTDFLNAQNHLRQTPLHLAVITNQPAVCQRLLTSGCDVTLVDNRGDTPLHIACRHGNLHCFSVITQNSRQEALHATMAAWNYNGVNCLHLAAVHGFLSLVENLLGLGAFINAKEQRSGRAALHLAVEQQNLLLVRLLLQKGADPNLLTSGGHTPYMLTHGLANDELRKELLPLTRPHLRELPDSESDDSEEEEEEGSDEELGYDDIQWNGH